MNYKQKIPVCGLLLLITSSICGSDDGYVHLKFRFFGSKWAESSRECLAIYRAEAFLKTKDQEHFLGRHICNPGRKKLVMIHPLAEEELLSVFEFDETRLHFERAEFGDEKDLSLNDLESVLEQHKDDFFLEDVQVECIFKADDLP